MTDHKSDKANQFLKESPSQNVCLLCGAIATVRQHGIVTLPWSQEGLAAASSSGEHAAMATRACTLERVL